MIPDYSDEGFLPKGIYKAKWHEILEKFGFNNHRISLLKGLKRALINLKTAGCTKVYIDGSFVTNKELPDDYDCCWNIQNVDSKKLDPVFLDFRCRRAAQKTKYLGEFFPANWPANTAREVYLDFFQKDKHTGNVKGIILINLEEFEND